MTDLNWFAFSVIPQGESQSVAWLRMGQCHAWYPVETYWKIIARGHRRKVQAERKIIPGYIFAQMHHSRVIDAVHDCRFIRGVLGWGLVPAYIPDAQMERMRVLPEILAAKIEAERQARIIRPGDRAEVMDGPLTGHIVQITDVHNGLVRFLVPLFGGMPGAAIEAKVRKVG